MHDQDVLDYTNDYRPSLLKAFKIFQAQSEMLEKSHKELEARLDTSQLSLASKNKELASRVAEIEEIKERLSGILESITDAVFLSDSQGKVEIANRAAIQLFDGDLLDTGLANWPVLIELINSDRTIRDSELVLTIDDDDQTFLISLIPMTKSSSSDNLKVVSMKNVTEHRRLQQKVALERRMAALGQVAASVAHEIRNPLCGIEGFATLLKRDLKHDPTTQELALKIIYATRQLNAVVSNLLNYSREMRCQFDRHNICDLINQLTTVLQPMADDREIEIIHNYSGAALQADIDSVQIGQVITNLIVNAIEACPRKAGGRVTIRARETKKYLYIESEDNGCGIAQNEINSIFEPFFTTKDGGIGLGLALCKRIIETHDGTISCNSVVAKGTTFTIKLKKTR